MTAKFDKSNRNKFYWYWNLFELEVLLDFLVGLVVVLEEDEGVLLVAVKSAPLLRRLLARFAVA